MNSSNKVSTSTAVAASNNVSRSINSGSGQCVEISTRMDALLSEVSTIYLFVCENDKSVNVIFYHYYSICRSH